MPNKPAALEVYRTKKSFAAIAEAEAERFNVHASELSDKDAAARASQVFTIILAILNLHVIDNKVSQAVVNEINVPQVVQEAMLEAGYTL